MDNDKIIKSAKILECTDFDTAIALTGYGKFHVEILAVCALSLLSTGFQNGLSAYIFPSAQFSLNITSTEIGFLNVSFLIGATCSSVLWGILADLSGRRKVLICSLFLDFCVTIVLAFMNTFYGFAICRLLNGFLIGAPGSVTFTYLAEFHEPKLRMKIICYSGIFFTLSWLMLPILSYLVLPLDIDVKITENLSFTSWRLFLLIISVPELITCLWFFKLPESPKFLECRGNYKEAQKILKEIYTINTRNDPNDYPVKTLKKSVIVAATATIKDNVKIRSKTKRILQQVLKQIRTLFRPPLLGLTMLISVITFANMFGYFGLVLWIPDLFAKFDQYNQQHPNMTVTLKKFNAMGLVNDANLDKVQYIPEFNFVMFRNTLIIGLCSIIGSVLSGWFVGKISIKTSPTITMLLGGLSSGFIYLVQSVNQFFVLACVFQSAMTTANMVLGSIVVELFPTSVSAMAFCATICIGRVGAIVSNLIFGLFMDRQCEIPIFLVCAISTLGGLLCLLIPTKEDIDCTVGAEKRVKFHHEIQHI